jgi:transcriptional regulator with XRE-family HTH domain
MSTTISERLKALREARSLTQEQLNQRLEPFLRKREKGSKKGGGRWISERENGKARVSVEDAEAIAQALGYASAFIILEGEHRELLGRLSELRPEDATFVLRLSRALPRLTDAERTLFLNMAQSVLDRGEDHDQS